jgi:ADP-ribose pyrophosphatase YjhB (NUDIX family)
MQLITLENKIRKEIFFLINQGICKFNELKNRLKIRSNDLSYHLTILKKAGLIETKNNLYRLTEKSRNMFPYRKVITEKEIPLMSVTSVAILDGDKILLQKKANEPGKGRYLLYGGTIKFEDAIKESAKKEAEKQSGAELSSLKFRGILETTVYKGKEIQQHWLVHVFTAKATTVPKNGEWFNIKKLPKKLFLDTNFIVSKVIKNKTPKNYSWTIKNNKEIIVVN